MVFALTWLPGVLEEAGLKVAEVDGWQRRGCGEMGRVLGVMCHHTVNAREGNMPSLGVLINGRADLPGPLAQLGLGRDGTYYVVAAGRCNHAGRGWWRGVAAGNAHFIGIEAEHSGRAGEAWPEVQMEAYRRGVAAILKHLQLPAEHCCGHGEYALPPGRKSDPCFDMTSFRRDLVRLLRGEAPPPVLIPPVEPQAPAPNRAPRRTLRRGATGELVNALQERLGVDRIDGYFGPKTEAAVRQWQRSKGLVPDGIVGPKTWATL